MQILCEKLTKLSIPAIRAEVSCELYKKYGMSQKAIAEKLGIAQPAVYKYLNGSYSKNVAEVAKFLSSSKACRHISKAIASGCKPESAQAMIEKLASSKPVLSYCKSVFGQQ